MQCIQAYDALLAGGASGTCGCRCGCGCGGTTVREHDDSNDDGEQETLADPINLPPVDQSIHTH